MSSVFGATCGTPRSFVSGGRAMRIAPRPVSSETVRIPAGNALRRDLLVVTVADLSHFFL